MGVRESAELKAEPSKVEEELDGTIPTCRRLERLSGSVLRDGWQLDRTKGSHRQYRHPNKPGTVTIAGKMSKDLAPKTWHSILKQAGLD